MQQSLSYRISLDDKEFLAALIRDGKEMDRLTRRISDDGEQIDAVFRKIGQVAGITLGINALKNFAMEVINVRGQIQQLGIAFETMLGSKQQADTMMREIIDFAQKTPFTLTDVADNAKQLMAMGIASEKVMDTLKSLGDVAAGLSVPMWRLAVNYGQVSALGKLQTREIRDFAMAGVPIVEELSKQLGKSSKEIYAMVEAGEVGFPMVEQAFKNMSGEGGKFYNLMEKQNSSVTGQIEKLKDQIIVMMNSIGESNEGFIYTAIEGAQALVANYEAIGKVLISLIATYGAYKAAVITVGSVQRIGEVNAIMAEDAALKKLLTTEQQEAIVKGEQTAAGTAYISSVKAQVLANLEAAKVEASKAAMEVNNAKQAIIDQRLVLTARKANVIAAKQELAAAIDSGSAKKIATAETKLNTAVTLQNAAAKDLHAKKTALSTVQETAQTKAKAVNTLQNGINTASEAGLTAAQQLRVFVVRKLAAAQAFLNSTMLANPYVLATVAIVGLGAAIWALYDGTTAEEKAQKKLNKELDEARQKREELISQSDEYISTIYSETSSILEQVKAYQKLKDAQPEALKGLTFEQVKGMSAEEVKKLVDTAADKKELDDLSKKYEDATKKAEKLKETIKDLKSSFGKDDADAANLYLNEKKLKEAEVEIKAIRLELDKVNELRKEAEFQSKSESERLSIYKEQEKGLQAQREYLEGILSANRQLVGSVNPWSIELSSIIRKLGIIQNNIKAIENRNVSAPKAEAFWKEQLDSADKVIKGIESSTLKMMKAGTFKVVTDKDKEELEKYQKAIKDKNEAQRELAVYEEPKKGERTAEKARKKEEDLLKNQQDYADKQRELALSLEASRVAIMEDGINKRLALSDSERDKALEKIVDERNALIEGYNKANNLKGEDKVTAETFQSKMPDEYAAIQEKTLNTTKEYANKRNEIEKEGAKNLRDIWEGVYDFQFEELDKQILEIKRKYEELGKGIDKNLKKNEGESDEDFEKRRAEERVKLEERCQEEITRATLQYSLKRNEINKQTALEEQELANDRFLFEADKKEALLKIEKQYAEERLEFLKKLQDLGDTSVADDIIKTENAIKKINSQLKKIPIDRLKEALDTKGVSEGIKKLSGTLKELGEATDNEALSNFGDMLSELSDIVSKFASGDIIGGVLSVIDTIVSSFADIHKQQKENAESALAYKRALELIDLSRLVPDEDVFGANSFVRARKAMQAAKEAWAAYQKLLSGGGSATSRGRTATTGYNADNIANRAKALADMRIKTVDKNWFQETILGKKDEYKTLKELAPDIFANGGFDTEKAKAFLSTNKNITDEQRKQIQHAIDLAEKYEEFLDIVREDIEDTFGHLGSSMTDAIVKSIETGTDAWGDFKMAASDAMETLGKKLIYDVYLMKVFTKLQDRLLEDYKQGGTPEEIAERQAKTLAAMMPEMEESFYLGKEAAKKWKELMEQYGFDQVFEEERSGMSEGITKASQDSIDELSGRTLATNILLANIRDIQFGGQIRLIGISKQIGDIGADFRSAMLIFQQLGDVNGNTIFQQQLQTQIKIEQNTRIASEYLNSIVTYGVKVRVSDS